MPLHIDELQSTVEIQGDSSASGPSTSASPPPASDALTERLRSERERRDRERLRAEGYAD